MKDSDPVSKLLADADRRGLSYTVAGVRPDAPAAAGRPPLVEPIFVAPGTWYLPLLTASEANGRDWKARSARTQAARLAVSRSLGRRLDYLAPFARQYHAGRPLCVRLTRLAPHRLDLANLGVALKGVEDAVALMLGADDGSPLWLAQFRQEPQGRYGVVLTLAVPDAEGGAA